MKAIYDAVVAILMAAAIVVVLMLLGSMDARAAPFVVSDPVDANADTCVHKLDGAVDAETELGQDRGCKIDLAGVAPGQHQIQVKVRSKTNPGVWADSAYVPFSFVLRGTLADPLNIRLAPQ